MVNFSSVVFNSSFAPNLFSVAYSVSKPNLFNFNPNSNQDEYDLNDNTWLRNSHSYNLNEKNSYYEYLIFPNKLKEHISEVKTIDVGSIESVGVVTGGINYKVGDELILDVTNIGSGGFKSKVSKISGKGVNSVSVSSTSITNIEFYPVGGSGNFIGFSSLPHGLNNFDLNIWIKYIFFIYGGIL